MKLEKINDKLKQKDTLDIIKWSYDTFKNSLIMTSSFGEYSAVMLHLVKRIVPNIPIIFIDTGYLTQETYFFVEKLRKGMDLNLYVYSSKRTTSMQEAVDGLRWKNEKSKEFEEFKYEVKLEPLERALVELNVKAWLSGVRKDESEHRKNFEIIMKDKRGYKIHPIFYWTKEEVKEYISKNNLMVNENYFDICKGEEQKKECGIHCFIDGKGI